MNKSTITPFSRFHCDGKAPIPGYQRFVDLIEEKHFWGRILPKVQGLQEPLAFWSTIRHPAFLDLLHVHEEDDQYLILLAPIEPGPALTTMTAANLKPDTLLQVFCELASACQFLSHQNRSFPQLDLSKIFYSSKGLRIVGHETSPLAQSGNRERQVIHLDVRYAAPEFISDKRRTDASSIFHLGALFYHFLAGKPLPRRSTLSNEADADQLGNSWQPLLKRLLHPNPLERLNWQGLWCHLNVMPNMREGRHQAPTLLAEPNPPARTFLTERLRECRTRALVIGHQQPTEFGAYDRLAPFLDEARSLGFKSLRVRVKPEKTKDFQVLNDLISLLKTELLPLANRPDSNEPFDHFSVWKPIPKLIARWHQSLTKLLETLVPDRAEGLVLVIEDFQHIDEESLNGLIRLTSWLADFPFLLLVSAESLLHPKCQTLQSKVTHWSQVPTYFWDRPTLEHHVWTIQPQGSDLYDKAMSETAGHELLMPVWWLDSNPKKLALQKCLERSWSHLAEQEQRALQLLACSPRPLSEHDLIQLGFSTRNEQGLAQIHNAGLLSCNARSAFQISVPGLRRTALERVPTRERILVYQRLLTYERHLDKPDLVQLVVLAVFVNDPEKDVFLAQLEERIYRRFELDLLWDLEHRVPYGKHAVLRDFFLFAHFLRGQAWKPRLGGGSELIQDLTRATRARANDPEMAGRIYLSITKQRTIQLPQKAYALVLALECAVLAEDPLMGHKALRRLARLNLNHIEPDLRDQWWARALGATYQLGQDYALARSRIPTSRSPLARWATAWQAWKASDFTACLQILEEVVPSLANFYDLNWRGALWKLYGNALYRNYQPERSIKAYQMALDCFQQTENTRAIEEINFNLAGAENLAGHFDASRIRFQTIYKHALQQEDSRTRCQLLYHIMVCDLFQHEIGDFERHFSEHANLANQLTEGDERLKGIVLRLQLALERPKEKNRLDLEKIQSLKHKGLNELVLEEIFFAERLAHFSMGREDLVPTEPLPFHTAWRHQFLDFLLGKGQLSFVELLANIGDGYLGANHFLLLKTAIEIGLIPQKELTSKLANLFETHTTQCNAAYGQFLRTHFQGHQGLAQVGREHWDRAMNLFERLRIPAHIHYRMEILEAIKQVWAFEDWGFLYEAGPAWLEIPGMGNQAPPEVLDQLDWLGHFEPNRPILTPIQDPMGDGERGLLLLPVSQKGATPTLIWMIHDRSTNQELGIHYEPLFRFYARLLSLILPSLDSENRLPKTKYSHGMVGQCAAMQELHKSIQSFGRSNLNIYIWGESGTGKELVAHAIHQASDRANKPFRAINCSHFPESLVEAELFGHKRGSFTGAETDKAGLLELVDGGTLFLDEIGDIDAKVQSLLLRVIQEGEYSRIGERDIRKVDIRFITATNKDLRQLIEDKLFREDLFFRIVQEELNLPPLRARLEDLPQLVYHFTVKYQPNRVVMYRSEFFDHLRTYRWPGNVRELESYVQKVLIHWPQQNEFGLSQTLPFLLPEGIDPDTALDLETHLHQQKATFVRDRLRKFGGNRSRAAVSLGISRQAVVSIIHRYDLE